MANLEFHPGDIVRVVDLSQDETFATQCGLPLGWSGRFATITKAVEIYEGNYYCLDYNQAYRFPARALKLIKRERLMINQKVCNCLVGHLDFGFQPPNLTAKEYILWMERDEAVMKRHFERYVACPRCGRKIEWPDEGF